MSDEAQIKTELAIVWEGDKAVFAKAFVAAQKSMEAVKKASTNPAFKTKYADLSEVVEATLPALNAAGIGVMQFPVFDGTIATVTTIFLHESGASVTGVLSLWPSKTDPQGAGSAFTYGRRYSLLAMTGAAPEDDDGNAASGPRERARDNMPAAHERAIATLRALDNAPGLFKEKWLAQKDGWKALMEVEDYMKVVAVMKEISAAFPKAEEAPVAPEEHPSFEIDDDMLAESGEASHD